MTQKDICHFLWKEPQCFALICDRSWVSILDELKNTVMMYPQPCHWEKSLNIGVNIQYKVNVLVNQQNSFNTLLFSPKTMQCYPARMIQHFWKQSTQSISLGMSYLGGYFDLD